MVRVAKQIVHSVRIHLTADEIAPENVLFGFLRTLQQSSDIVRSETVVARVKPMVFDNVSEVPANNRDGVIFVGVLTARKRFRQQVLGGVGKRPVAHIVEQCRQTNQLPTAQAAAFLIVESLPERISGVLSSRVNSRGRCA